MMMQTKRRIEKESEYRARGSKLGVEMTPILQGVRIEGGYLAVG